MGKDPKVDDFENRIAMWFKRMGIELEVPALVAFSGGPDSTALLAALAALGAGPLRAVYVDHGIRPRPEREAEVRLVAANAGRLAVPLEVRALAEGLVAAHAGDKGIGIEAAARAFRHEALRSAAEAFGAERIYIGHTRDDDLEGLLMRFLRGSGSAGLRGLRAVDGIVARPLLDVGRAEVSAYLRARNLEASLDSTNSDDQILRNRVRRRLVPFLDVDFPGWRGGVARAAERLALDDEALASLAAEDAFEKSDDGSRRIEFERFDSLPKGLRFRALASAIDDFADEGACSEFPGGRVPARMLNEIIACVADGISFSGHGLWIRREGPYLKMGPSLDFEGDDGYFVVLNESDIGLEGSVAAGAVVISWTEYPDTAGIPEGSFDFPLIVRTRRPGDFIALSAGSKAIDRIFGSWGLAAGFRNKVPVVQDRRGILAVLGSRAPRGKDVFRTVNSGAATRRLLSLRLKGA